MLCRVEKERGRNRRYLAYLDQELMGPLYFDDLRDLKLKVPADGEFTEKDIEEPVRTEILDRLYTRALSKAESLLAVTEHCEKEIRFKLSERNFSEPVIDLVIDELREKRELDDRRYAEAYIRAYAPKKSRSLVLKELELKDIFLPDAEEIYDQVLADEGIEEDRVIDRLLYKKFHGQDLENEKVRRRAVQFLTRHGYLTSEIFRCFDRLSQDPDIFGENPT